MGSLKSRNSFRYLTAAVAAAGVGIALAASPVHARTTEVLDAGSPNAIPGEYIVAFKEATEAADALVRRFDGRVDTRLESINAVAVHMDAADAARLAADPAVDYVEQNLRVETAATQLNPPGWGADRVDQRTLPLNGSYTYPNTGTDVHAYIIDTGIWLEHPDFAGRLDPGYSAIVPDGNSRDCHGHGTHIAGTLGGTLYGIAKQVRLVPVQVFNCTGTGDSVSVIAGVEWVTQNAIKPAVATMSLTATASQAIDTAVETSIASGVSYAVAAGNYDADACGYSPARVPGVLTVAATDSTDTRVSFSNWGTCVDMFAPGVNVRSDYLFNVTTRLSGTSIAVPHVAGAAAIYLSANPTATPATVASALIGNSTASVVIDPEVGTPNRMLFVSLGEDAGPVGSAGPALVPGQTCLRALRIPRPSRKAPAAMTAAATAAAHHRQTPGWGSGSSRAAWSLAQPSTVPWSAAETQTVVVNAVPVPVAVGWSGCSTTTSCPCSIWSPVPATTLAAMSTRSPGSSETVQPGRPPALSGAGSASRRVNPAGRRCATRRST